MEHIIISVDNQLHAQLLMRLMENLSFVKSVRQEKRVEYLTAADWVRPGRPATNEELKNMLDECEAEVKAGKVLTLEEAKTLTKQKFGRWKKANSM